MARPPTEAAGAIGTADAEAEAPSPADTPTPLALVIIDADGRVVRFNAEATALFGYPEAETVGRRLSDLIIPESMRAAHEAGLARYRRSGTGPVLDQTFEMPALRRDGTELRVQLTVSQLKIDGRDLLVGALRRAGPEPVVPAELSLSADFHRAIVERAPILIAVLGNGDGERWLSPATERLLGARPGTPLSEVIPQLVHPADRERAYRVLTDPASLGESVELRLRARDGGWRAISFVAADLRDHPAVEGVVHYGIDVTRARAAEEREREESARLLALLDGLAVGVLVEDGAQHIQLANPALVEIFELGVRPTRLAGADLAGQAPPDVDAAGWAALRRVTADARYGTRELTLAQGRVVECVCTGIVVDGGPMGRLWLIHDVTESAAARRVLEQHNRQLAALSALKSEFIAIVSHELRTPLTTISAFTEMLGGPGELTSPDAPEALAAIARNTDRMLVLVHDLRLLSQLETGDQAVATGAVDLADLIREVGDEIETGGGRVITLRHEVADGPLLDGDEQLLRQLVHTVIGTVAACAAGDEMTLRAGADEAGWMVSATAASGEFITDEQLLATPLPVLDDASRQRSAALSVLLARAIAQSHGGTLVTEVRPGETATITVRLPFGGRAAWPADTTGGPPGPAAFAGGTPH